MHTTKIMGELRPVNTVTTTSPVVRDEAAHYTPSGRRVPAADVYARRVARESENWLVFATERTRMRPDTLVRKALDACAFTVSKEAASLAVPSKLCGVSGHQPALWAMVKESVAPWAPLDLDASSEGLAVLYGGERIGEVQPKHLAWVRPLVPFGLKLYLARVTGHEREGYRLGCNVVFGHVGSALMGLLDALGETGPGGDGSAGDGSPRPTLPSASVPRTMSGSGACPAPRHLELVVLPEREALSGDRDDVVLYRDIDGTAKASVPHVARHSPTGIEWGYRGSGPSDLARSVLISLFDEATADKLYRRFCEQVVARVPAAGGVIRARDVRRWVDAQL